MYLISLCDNDEIFANTFDAQLAQCLAPSSYSLRTFATVNGMRRAIENGYRPDIAFMDIDLGDTSALEAATKFFEAGSGTQVVLVTGYSEVCSSVHESYNVYFLLKPVSEQTLKKILAKAIRGLGGRSDDVLTVRTGKRILNLRCSSIVYIESSKRRLIFYTDGETVEIYMSMNELKKRLPEEFALCHKSFAVNLSRVREMVPDHFVMDTGHSVPISQKRRAETRRRFLEYRGNVL